MKHLGFLSILTLGAVALASAATLQKTSLTLGGKALSLDTVTVNGKAYVSLAQLKAQMGRAEGGASQMAAREGAMGEWLFNGVFRLRVTKVEWDGERNWDVSMELRNGTSVPRRPGGNGLADIPTDALFAQTEGGDTLQVYAGQAPELQDALGYKTLLPGAGAKVVLHFRGKADDRPTKFLMEFKPKAGWPYEKDPSFRVDLARSRG